MALAARLAAHSRYGASTITRSNVVSLHLLALQSARSQSSAARASSAPIPRRKLRLVVVGSGWASFAFTRKFLEKSKAASDEWDVTLISKVNHMVFTPLLASTTTGTLEFRSISEPVKDSFPSITYQRGEVTDIDPERKTVSISSEQIAPKGPAAGRLDFQLPFDILVVGCGAINNTFGIPNVEKHMLFLKELQDAREIRKSIIRNIEAAAIIPVTAEERKRLLSFVIVGGGPTGVEFSAELHDFVKEDLARLYPELVKDISITIVEGRSILGAFDASLREYAEKRFRREGIRVRTGANVVRVEPSYIQLSDGERLPYGLGVWNTGIGPRPLVKRLDASVWKKDRWGHLVTDAFLRVQRTAEAAGGSSHSSTSAFAPAVQTDPASSLRTDLVADAPFFPGIYALGDAASVSGRQYAATAQVAEQQGSWLGQHLATAFEATAAVTCRTGGAEGAMSASSADLLPPAVVDRGSINTSSVSDVSSTDASTLSDAWAAERVQAAASWKPGRQIQEGRATEIGLKIGKALSKVLSRLQGESNAAAPAAAPTAAAASPAGVDPSAAAVAARQEAEGGFLYRHGGSLAFLGSMTAVNDFTGARRVAPLYDSRIRGHVAWLIWRGAYLTKLGSWRNKVQVPAEWLRTLIFGRDTTQF